MKKFLIFSYIACLVIALFAFHTPKDCPPDGRPNPKKGSKAELKPRERNLNRHINRETSPQPSDFDKAVTIQGMYDSKDDSIYSEDKAANLIGYIFRAMDVGMESCNCYTEDKTKYSVNVFVSTSPITKQTRTADCIVAVITPYSRTLNKDWSADYVNDKLVGKQVKLTGWLIYNYLKGNTSVGTNTNSTELDRRTIWGICPTTAVMALD